jgi:hypothetical protein
MSEITNIIEGYTNLLRSKAGISNAEVEQLAQLRLDACGKCVENDQLVLQEGRCTKCGCVMAAKTRSLTAKCPLRKW